MKKLMIAAGAIALAGVTFAGICDGSDPVVEKAAQRAYDFKASLKLVDGKTATTTTKTKGSICVNPTSSTATSYYRIKASRTFKGVFIDCDTCKVQAIKDGEVEAIRNGHAADQLATGTAAFYVSSSDTKYKAVYNAKVYDDANTDYGYQFQIANFIGGESFAKSKVAEGLVQFNILELDKFNEYRTYSLLAAGFGSRDGDLIKTLCGNLAGAVSAATWCGIWTQCYEPCLETPFYDAMALDDDGNMVYEPQNGNAWQAPLETSPAFDAVYGTWSIKYSSSKSKLTTEQKVVDKTFGSGWYTLTKSADIDIAFPFAFIALGAQQ